MEGSLTRRDLKHSNAIRDESTEEYEDTYTKDDSPVAYGLPKYKMKSRKEAQKIISQHSVYQGLMTTTQAKKELDNHGEHCYLIRYSSRHETNMLSVLFNGKVTNFPILVTANHDSCEYEIEGSDKKFDDISELLHHYQENSPNDEIENIGKPYISCKRAKLEIPSHLDISADNYKESEGNDSPIAKAQKYVNTSCLCCKKQVLQDESVSFHLHKSCFKCATCNSPLESNVLERKHYCHHHNPLNFPQKEEATTINPGIHHSLPLPKCSALHGPPSLLTRSSPQERPVARVRAQAKAGQGETTGSGKGETEDGGQVGATGHRMVDDAPSLVDFIAFPMANSNDKVNLAVQIENYHDFGVLLLNDKSGELISSIVTKQSGNPLDIVREVFRMWLKGTGKQPVTWDTLADVLCDIRMNKLASDIRNVIHGYS